jgi:hypothetical protein
VRAIDLDTELRRAVEMAGCQVAQDAYGFRCGSGDALAVWEAFKELVAREVREPIVDDERAERLLGSYPDDDLLLFETGTMEAMHSRGYRLGGDPPQPQVLTFALTRQLSFTDEAGEYAGMAGLCVTVEHLLTPELQAVSGAQLWGHAGPPADGIGEDNPEFGNAWTGDVHAWTAAVERHPAFDAAMRRRDAFHVGFLYTDI